MKLPNRKTKVERVIGKVDSPQELATTARHGIESAVSATAGSDAVKKAGKPTLLAAAGVAGVTAINAVLSSLRKRDAA